MTYEEIQEYEFERAYLEAALDAAMHDWREDVKRIQEQLEARGFTPDEAEECALRGRRSPLHAAGGLQ